jgi:rubrerythrin
MSLMSGRWIVYKCRQCNCKFAIANETDKDGISFCPSCDVIDAEFLGEQLID